MDSHEYGPQPGFSAPSGLPVPPQGQMPQPAQQWAQPPAAPAPSGLPAQHWAPPAAAQPYDRPPATDPAHGPTLSAFSAYGQSPAAPQAGLPYGQPSPYGQMPPGGGQGWPPYLVQPAAAPGPYVPRRGPGRKIAAIAVAAVVALGGASAFAADAWAKGQVCDAIQDLTGASTAGGGGGGGGGGRGEAGDDDAMPTSAQFDEAVDGLNGRARLLFFHGELKDATHGLADDIASIKQLTQADPGDAAMTEMLAVAASVDSHARKAQRACGLPERSLFARPV